MSDFAIPDYVEPLEGWRVWRVSGEEQRLRLLSVVQDTVWPLREELVADCRKRHAFPRLRRGAKHRAPSAECQCGIYATGLEHLGALVGERSWQDRPYIFGQVLLWGTVVECERGWRASHAYPSRLFVPSPRRQSSTWSEQAAQQLGGYAVPVEPLSLPAREALEVLTGRRGRLRSLR